MAATRLSVQLSWYPATPRSSYRYRSQAAMSVSWMPGEVSSSRVRMGRRLFVTMLSPTLARNRFVAVRVCSIDMNSVTSAWLKAQVSMTCWPWVLITLSRRPASTKAALPRRAGMVTENEPVIASTPARRHLTRVLPCLAPEPQD